MRYFPWMLVVATACGGDGKEATGDDCDELAPIDVTVTVTDPSGQPVVAVETTSVKLDGEPCADNGDGSWLCVADPNGENQLAIIDTRYDVHAEFLTLEFGCEAGTFEHAVQLDAMMGS